MSKFKVGDKVVRVKPSTTLERNGIYTISQTMEGLSWVGVEEYQDKDSGGYPFCEDSFELYQEPPCPVYADPVMEQNHIVTEWLDKFLALATSGEGVESIVVAYNKQLCLQTIHGDIHHTSEIIGFINNRYSQLTEQANNAKRDKLLADIVKAKSEYERLVGELSESEKGL